MIQDIVERQADVEALCRRFAVSRLEVFGSAVNGAFRNQDSDLDFLVEFQAPDVPGYADRYFGLLECLEQLFGRSADLIVDSAVKNPYFRESLLQSKVLLYAA
ncbi:MAG: nucleotidyltransferase family protein [Dehalococcoidia bacterium]